MAAGVVIAGGCTVGSGGVCAFGAPAIVGGMTSLGTYVGAAADIIAQNSDAIALEMGKISEEIGRKIHRGIKIAGAVVGILTGNKPPEPPREDETKPRVEQKDKKPSGG